MLPGTKTARPLELDKDHGFAWIQGGLWANIKKRDIWNIKSIWHIKDISNIEDIYNIQDFRKIGSREAFGRTVRRDIWMFKIDIFVSSLWQDASFWCTMQQQRMCNSFVSRVWFTKRVQLETARLSESEFFCVFKIGGKSGRVWHHDMYNSAEDLQGQLLRHLRQLIRLHNKNRK